MHFMFAKLIFKLSHRWKINGHQGSVKMLNGLLDQGPGLWVPGLGQETTELFTNDRRRTKNTNDKCVDLEISNESEFCDPGPYLEWKSPGVEDWQLMHGRYQKYDIQWKPQQLSLISVIDRSKSTGTWTGTEWPLRTQALFSASVGIRSSERRISHHSLSDLRRLSEWYKDLQDRITKVHPHRSNF